MKMKRRDILWNRGKQTFSINGKTINVLGFAGPVLSVATTYSHHCSMKKKAIDNTQICARLCSNKTLLTTTGGRLYLALGIHLANPCSNGPVQCGSP